VSQLEAADTSPGTGAIVKAGDTVTVDYTGAVASTGIIFQSSKDSGQPVTFPLNQVIAGWSQGIPGMKVGGTRRLLIPANLAYGANPPAGSGIPANADLVFDVTLHSIGK
jgi:FKBP-type peptidyl-prolyl cis-trans isomerase